MGMIFHSQHLLTSPDNWVTLSQWTVMDVPLCSWISKLGTALSPSYLGKRRKGTRNPRNVSRLQMCPGARLQMAGCQSVQIMVLKCRKSVPESEMLKYVEIIWISYRHMFWYVLTHFVRSRWIFSDGLETPPDSHLLPSGCHGIQDSVVLHQVGLQQPPGISRYLPGPAVPLQT